VPPGGGDLEERRENEGAGVEEWVWQDQTAALTPRNRPVEAAATVIEYVDIQRPRLHRRGRLAPRAALDLLEKAQQAPRSYAATGRDNGIQIARLAAAAHRVSLIEV
jgi:hypothetical protein